MVAGGSTRVARLRFARTANGTSRRAGAGWSPACPVDSADLGYREAKAGHHDALIGLVMLARFHVPFRHAEVPPCCRCRLARSGLVSPPAAVADVCGASTTVEPSSGPPGTTFVFRTNQSAPTNLALYRQRPTRVHRHARGRRLRLLRDPCRRRRRREVAGPSGGAGARGVLRRSDLQRHSNARHRTAPGTTRSSSAPLIVAPSPLAFLLVFKSFAGSPRAVADHPRACERDRDWEGEASGHDANRATRVGVPWRRRDPLTSPVSPMSFGRTRGPSRPASCLRSSSGVVNDENGCSRSSPRWRSSIAARRSSGRQPVAISQSASTS